MKLGILTAWLCLMLPVVADGLKFRTHWVGNTFGGGEKWVQNFAEGMAVAKDGTCYVCSGWDEGGREVGIYRGGDVIGKCEDLHGWGRSGGEAVAVDDEFVYVATSQEGGFKHPELNKNQVLSFPPKGTKWFGIRRYTREGKYAPFPTGAAWGESLAILNTVDGEKAPGQPVTGLCVEGSELFASCAATGKIHVLDKTTMEVKRTFPATEPRGLAMAAGKLWVIERGAVSTYDPGGKKIIAGIIGTEDAQGMVASALATDADGRLLVADAGPRQQVYMFNVGGEPKMIRKLGEPEGLYSAPSPGRTGPFRFANPRGVGADKDGNLYVACNPARNGCVIRSFKSDRRTMNWELLGLEFVDVCDADTAADGAWLYSVDGCYSFDVTKPAGENWQWVAQTLNPFRYPDDLRRRAGHLEAGPKFFSGGGQRFLAIRGMWQGLLGIYRLEADLAIPSAVLSASHYEKDGWSPPHQPEKDGWLWRDANGNGQMDEGEYSANPGPRGEFWASNVDSRGDIWQGDRKKGITRWTCGGVEKNGTPIYSADKIVHYDTPAEITDLLRTDYQAESDVMFLTGQTAERPITGGEWGTVGTEVFCYDGWTKPDRRLRYRVSLPYEAGKKWIVSFCTAGDLFFAVDCKSAEVFVHATPDGRLLGSLKPGPEVHGESGWVDFRDAIRAIRRKDGSYLVFVEEDAKGKTLVYHLDDPLAK